MAQSRNRPQPELYLSRQPKEHFVSEFGTRRKFFERINLALTGFVFTRALPFQTALAAHAPVPELVDYYDKLGLTKTINAAGTCTYRTGAAMPPRLQSIWCTPKTYRRRLASTSLDGCAAKSGMVTAGARVAILVLGSKLRMAKGFRADAAGYGCHLTA